MSDLKDFYQKEREKKALVGNFDNAELFGFDERRAYSYDIFEHSVLAMTRDQFYLNVRKENRYICKLTFTGEILYVNAPNGVLCKSTRNIARNNYVKINEYFFSCDENANKLFNEVANNAHLIRFISPEKAKEYSRDYVLLAKCAISSNPCVFHELNIPAIAPYIEEFVAIITEPGRYKKDFFGYNHEDDWEKNAEVIFSCPMEKPVYNRVLSLLERVFIRKLCLMKYINPSMLNDPIISVRRLCVRNPDEFEYIKYTGVTAALIHDYYTLAKWYIASGYSCYKARMQNINKNCLSNKEYSHIATIAAKLSHRNLYHIDFDNPEINAINLLRLGLWSKEFPKSYSRCHEKNLVDIIYKVKNAVIQRIFIKRFLTYRPYLINLFWNRINDKIYEPFLERISKVYPYVILYASKDAVMRNKEIALAGIKEFIVARNFSDIPDETYWKIKIINEYEFYHYAAIVAKEHYNAMIESLHFKDIRLLKKIEKLLFESDLTKKQKKTISAIINPLIHDYNHK